MPATVRLRDIVDELEFLSDETGSWLDTETGEVHTIELSLISSIEERDEPDDHLPEWQEEELEIAKRIVEEDHFLRLPTKWEIHEWQFLNEFAGSVTSPNVREELLFAIHGRGAFRNCKNIVERRGLADRWHEFRTEKLREIAIEWSEEHSLNWK